MTAWWMLPAGFAASFCVIAWMLRSGWVGAMDVPNERSLHQRVVPRSGGLGVLAGVGLGLALNLGALWWLAAALAAVAAVSWLDDRHSLPARVRFAVHLAAACGLAVFGGLPPAHGLATVLMVLGVVWLTNLYNFMDGADGLAGGMALFGFGAYGLAALWAGGMTVAMIAFAAAGAAAGFLAFNFHPARIFMGDVGSIPLGFLAGGLGLWGVREGLWTVPFVLLVFSPFMVDATVTLLRRALRGEKVWQAHREHFYQRLIQSGWGHRGTAWVAYALMVCAAGSALWARGAAPEIWWWLLAGWAGVYVLLGGWIDRRWRQFQERKPG